MTAEDPESPNYTNWLSLVEAEVRRLGAFQMEGYQQLASSEISTKRDATGEDSIVTRFDTESEAQLRSFLGQHFPDHSVLGEEGGNEVRNPDHYWILDPIDGTTNFTQGVPFWGPSVAYWYRGKPKLACIFFPALDSMYTSVIGGGSFCNGMRIRTADVSEYSMQTAVALHSRSHLTHSLELRTKVRVYGSFIGNVCLVAQGNLVAAACRGRLWDLAAGLLILQEAGAVADTQPAIEAIDIPGYLKNVPGGEVFIVYARANKELPPLQDFLQPVRPSTGLKGSG